EGAEGAAGGAGGGVGVLEGVRDEGADGAGQRERQRRARLGAERAQPRQVEPVDELEDLERVALADAEVEHGDDVGVVQLARDAGLVEEHAAEGRIVGVGREHALDGDAALEPLGAERDRLEDLGHAALAHPPGDPVPADVLHRSESPRSPAPAARLDAPPRGHWLSEVAARAAGQLVEHRWSLPLYSPPMRRLALLALSGCSGLVVELGGLPGTTPAAGGGDP